MTPEEARRLIAVRAAREFRDGDVVNLGIGIPLLSADFVPDGVEIFLHTENGLLGMGPTPSDDRIDPNLVNAAKQPVSEKRGAVYFDSALSFAMIRGGHVDLALLGALQVDSRGQVANWALPGRPILGVGGAMDLLVGAKRIVVLMTHTTKEGRSKLVNQCSFPITAQRCIDLLVTELGVFSFSDSGFVLEELQPGVSLEEIRLATEAPFTLSTGLDEQGGIASAGA